MPPTACLKCWAISSLSNIAPSLINTNSWETQSIGISTTNCVNNPRLFGMANNLSSEMKEDRRPSRFYARLFFPRETHFIHESAVSITLRLTAHHPYTFVHSFLRGASLTTPLYSQSSSRTCAARAYICNGPWTCTAHISTTYLLLFSHSRYIKFNMLVWNWTKLLIRWLFLRYGTVCACNEIINHFLQRWIFEIFRYQSKENFMWNDRANKLDVLLCVIHICNKRVLCD